MARGTSGKDRVGYGMVRYPEKTYFGKVLVIASKNGSGQWTVTISYPAVGPDPVDGTLAEEVEDVDTIRKLEHFIATHVEELGTLAQSLRKVRYTKRASNLEE